MIRPANIPAILSSLAVLGHFDGSAAREIAIAIEELEALRALARETASPVLLAAIIAKVGAVVLTPEELWQACAHAFERVDDPDGTIHFRSRPVMPAVLRAASSPERARRPDGTPAWKASELGEAAWLAYNRRLSRRRPVTNEPREWSELSSDRRSAWVSAAREVAHLVNPRDDDEPAEAAAEEEVSR